MRRRAKTRGEPAIAKENRLQAYVNIRAKIEALTLAIETVKGPRVPGDDTGRQQLLALLPDSRNRFCEWTTAAMDSHADPSWPVFHSNAAATLRDQRASDLLAEVISTTESVKALSKNQSSPPRSTEKVTDIRSELRVARIKADIADRELKAALAGLRTLRDEVVRLEAELKSLRNKSTEIARKKDREIDALNRRLGLTAKSARETK
ncbi:MAG: hypothetical protein V4684_04385 [Pseudomonadota bacterium]